MSSEVSSSWTLPATVFTGLPSKSNRWTTGSGPAGAHDEEVSELSLKTPEKMTENMETKKIEIKMMPNHKRLNSK